MGTHSHLVNFERGTTIPSVNNMYEYGGGGWGIGPRVHKVGEVKAYQEELIIKLIGTPLQNLARFNYYKMEVSLTFIIKKSEYWKRDTDNMTKATLDAIQKSTGINDSKYVKVIAEKQISTQPHESLLIVMVGYEEEKKKPDKSKKAVPRRSKTPLPVVVVQTFAERVMEKEQRKPEVPTIEGKVEGEVDS